MTDGLGATIQNFSGINATENSYQHNGNYYYTDNSRAIFTAAKRASMSKKARTRADCASTPTAGAQKSSSRSLLGSFKYALVGTAGLIAGAAASLGAIFGSDGNDGGGHDVGHDGGHDGGGGGSDGGG